MALDGTVTKVSGHDIGDSEILVLDVQGPAAYAIGGEALPANYFGLRCDIRVDAAEGRSEDPSDGYVKLNGTSGLLEFFTAADVEEADLTDLSANTYRLTVQGR